MGNDVFANGREISCKAGAGKSICAFPDVCFTPPQTPATPPGVPIPYPNTGFARDTTSGSRSVKISGKEVMLKNKSYFKKSLGDEAGCAPKKGILTSVNRGKVYFTSWSMDVKYEGTNVVRHLDLTTHNHASHPAQTPPWPFMDSMLPGLDKCDKEKEEEREKCSGHRGEEAKCADYECQRAQACKLVPYGGQSSPYCCPGKTGHHLVEVNCFTEPCGRQGLRTQIKMSKNSLLEHLNASEIGFEMDAPYSKGRNLPGFEAYDENLAPTVCADTSTGYTDHGAMHAVTERAKRLFTSAPILRDFFPEHERRAKDERERALSRWTYRDAADAGARAHNAVHPGCRTECTRAQLDAYHIGILHIEPDDPVRIKFSTYKKGFRWLKDNWHDRRKGLDPR